MITTDIGFGGWSDLTSKHEDMAEAKPAIIVSPKQARYFNIMVELLESDQQTAEKFIKAVSQDKLSHGKVEADLIEHIDVERIMAIAATALDN